jgi:hypothetical protein
MSCCLVLILLGLALMVVLKMRDMDVKFVGGGSLRAPGLCGNVRGRFTSTFAIGHVNGLHSARRLAGEKLVFCNSPAMSALYGHARVNMIFSPSLDWITSVI